MTTRRVSAALVILLLTAGAAHAGKADHPAAGRALGLADTHAKALNKNAGDALVVKSRSGGVRPRNASRTGPPTRASS